MASASVLNHVSRWKRSRGDSSSGCSCVASLSRCSPSLAASFSTLRRARMRKTISAPRRWRIAKDASINEHIEQMRLSATKALLERKDTIVIATVSSIYGLGAPESYLKMVVHLDRGDIINQRDLLRRFSSLQYTRNDLDFRRATFRVRGDTIDVYPADSDSEALRIELNS